MQHDLNIIERVQRGNLKGLKFAALVRLSFELLDDREFTGPILTGADINNREQQERYCRARVEALGGTFVGTYDEPNTSAWKKKRVKQPDGRYKYRVIRPVLYGALDDLKAGHAVSGHFTPADGGIDTLTGIDGLIVLDLDRLTRDLRTLEDAIEVAENYSRPFIDVSGTLDLLTEHGRNNARMYVTMAGNQSSATARRGKQSHLTRAGAGIPVGGVRPFGFKKDKRTHKKDEIRILRQTEVWLLDDGLTMRTVEQRWYGAGFRTSKGGRIPQKTIKNYLLNPRMAGIRTYRQPGKPLWERYLLGLDGKPVRGQWKPVFERRRWDKLVYLLTNPNRPGAGEYVGRLRYLYTPTLRCGECGGRLSGQAKENNRYDYACKNPGCGKVAGSGITIDEMLNTQLFEELKKRRVAVKPAKWEKATELKELEEERKKLIAQFNENEDMGPIIWPKIRAKDIRIKELRKERTAHGRKTKNPAQDNIEERWEDLALEQKHKAIAEVYEVVILNRATRKSNRFDPTRLKFVVKKDLSLERIKSLGFSFRGLAVA
jgi:DNA invertase Pin-like site-specific DNA recombinase